MKKFVQIGAMLLSASLLFWYSTFAQENVSIKTIESLKLAIDTVNNGDVILLDIMIQRLIQFNYPLKCSA